MRLFTIYAKMCFWVLACFFALSSTAQTTVNVPLLSVGKINDAGLTGTDLSGISTTTGNYRGWMKFDLSVIPNGSTINAATLSYPTIAGTINSTSTVNQLNALTFDPATAAWSTLISPNAGLVNIFTGAWAGTHPLALSTAAAPGGSAAATTALINYIQTRVGSSTAQFSLVRGSTNVYNFNTAPTLSVTYTPGTACAGTPTPSIVLASPSQICPGTSSSLSLSTSYSGIADLTFQWQSSPDSALWNNIAGANGISYSASPSSLTFYRCIISCTNSSLSDTADAVRISINPFLDCYCSSSANNAGDEEIYNVTLNGNSTNPLYAGTNGCTAPGPGPGSILDRYSNFKPLGSLADIQKGVTSNFSVEQNECDGATYYSAGIAIWIDYNQNGLFTDAGEQVYVENTTTISPRTATGSFIVPANAVLGNTVMRIVCAENLSGTSLVPCGTYDFGETEDFIVNVTPAPLCTNPPVAGMIAGPDSVCPGTVAALSVSGQSVGTDLQWQSSVDGQAWIDVPGQINSSYSPVVNSAAYYRVKITCVDSVFSDTLYVSVKNFLNCYCSSSADFAFDEEIYSVTLNGNSTNPLYAGANGCTTAAPGSGSVLSQYSNFTGLGALSTIYQGSTNTFSILQDECDGATYYSAGISIWIDFNQNGLFTDSAEQVYVENTTTISPRTAAGAFVVPSNALVGNTVMRIVCAEGFSGIGLTPCLSYGYGETEDFLVNVQPAPLCTTPADAGIASGPDTALVGPPSDYILSGYTGSAIQWQFALDSIGPWSNISGATNDTTTLFFNGPGTYYLRAIVFETGCPNDTSNFVKSVLIFRGDNVCDAVELSFGVNGPFTTAPATIQAGEPAPPGSGCGLQTGWCNNTITNTLWFKFIAPTSGRVSIQSPDFDTQLALWDADNCDTILLGGATLLYANDDDQNSAAHGGVLFSSYIDSAICLTPGKTYYVQLDAYTSPGGFTELVLTDLGNGPDASFTNLNPSYCPDAAPVSLIPGTKGGSFFGYGLTQDTIFDPSLALSQVGADSAIVIYYQLWACYQSTDTVVIDTLPLAIVNGQTNVSCFGGNNGAIDVITSGASPFVFNWSNSDITEDVSGLVAGSYTLTVQDSKGCSNTLGPVSITEPTAFSVSLDSVKNVKCAGDASGVIYVTSAGGTTPYTYSWSDNSANEDLTNVNGGAYSLTASDDLGCSSTLSASVSEPLAIAITVDSIANNKCNAENNGAIYISVANGTAPFTYLWSNTTTDEDAIDLVAGNYDVSVVDAIGCDASLDTVVTEPLALAVSLDTVINPTCNGSNNGEVQISVSGGTAAYSYAWSNNATSQDLSGLDGGSYTGTITDANGCSATATVTVNEPSSVTITLDSVSNVKCFGGNSGSILVSATGGTGTLNYIWSNSSTTQDLSGVSSGNYTLTASDANGCTATSSASISQPSAALTSSSTSTDAVLNGTNGSVNLSASGGTTPYSYLWSNGATTEDLSNVGAGTYTCTVTDANGCTTVQSDTVNLIIGIEDAGTLSEFNLFPNPSTGIINVTISTQISQTFAVEIVNTNGQSIAFAEEADATEVKFAFDLSNQSQGVYFARILANNTVTVRRFTLNR